MNTITEPRHSISSPTESDFQGGKGPQPKPGLGELWLAILALVSPPFIGAYSWIVLFGAGGFVRGLLREIGITMPPIYGLSGILIVFSLKFYPYVYLLVSGALSNVNRSLEEAAEGLGLTPWQRTVKISFPLILPALSATLASAMFMTGLPTNWATKVLDG